MPVGIFNECGKCFYWGLSNRIVYDLVIGKIVSRMFSVTLMQIT
jgi:hypothetical protein